MLKWICCIKAKDQSLYTSLGLLVIRVVAGTAFILHGWDKIQNPFGWMGPDSPTPEVFQALAAVSEFGGGIAWIIGLLFPLASFGLLCTMTVAVFTHAMVLGDPFVNLVGTGSYEPAAIYWCLSLLFILAGPGRFSLDRILFKK